MDTHGEKRVDKVDDAQKLRDALRSLREFLGLARSATETVGEIMWTPLELEYVQAAEALERIEQLTDVFLRAATREANKSGGTLQLTRDTPKQESS
jgi:hypothetical protein